MEQLTRRVSTFPAWRHQVCNRTYNLQQILQLRQQQQLPQRRRQQRHSRMVHQIPHRCNLPPPKASFRFRLDSPRLLQRPIPLRLRNRRLRLLLLLLPLHLRRMARLRIQHRRPIRRRKWLCITHWTRNRNRLRARNPREVATSYNRFSHWSSKRYLG